jgi:hypothetical protein
MIESLERLCGGFWKRKYVPLKYIKLITDIYDRAITSVRTSVGITSEIFFMYK